MQVAAKTPTRTGAELAELARAISQDLALPLTTISGFARLLLSRYDIELDDEAREQLDTIAREATDMQEMIDGVVSSLRTPKAAPSGAAPQPGTRQAVAA